MILGPYKTTFWNQDKKQTDSGRLNTKINECGVPDNKYL